MSHVRIVQEGMRCSKRRHVYLLTSHTLPWEHTNKAASNLTQPMLTHILTQFYTCTQALAHPTLNIYTIINCFHGNLASRWTCSVIHASRAIRLVFLLLVLACSQSHESFLTQQLARSLTERPIFHGSLSFLTCLVTMRRPSSNCPPVQLTHSATAEVEWCDRLK